MSYYTGTISTAENQEEADQVNEFGALQPTNVDDLPDISTVTTMDDNFSDGQVKGDRSLIAEFGAGVVRGAVNLAGTAGKIGAHVLSGGFNRDLALSIYDKIHGVEGRVDGEYSSLDDTERGQFGRDLAQKVQIDRLTYSAMGDTYEKMAENYQPSESVRGKSIFDDPKLLADPMWYANGIGEMVPSLLVPLGVGASSAHRVAQGVGRSLNASQGVALQRIGHAMVANSRSIVAGGAGGALEGLGLGDEIYERGGSSMDASAGAGAFGLASAFLNAYAFKGMLDAVDGPTFKSKAFATMQSGLKEAFTEALEEPTQASIGLLVDAINGADVVLYEEGIIPTITESLKAGVEVGILSAFTGSAMHLGGAPVRSKFTPSKEQAFDAVQETAYRDRPEGDPRAEPTDRFTPASVLPEDFDLQKASIPELLQSYRNNPSDVVYQEIANRDLSKFEATAGDDGVMFDAIKGFKPELQNARYIPASSNNETHAMAELGRQLGLKTLFFEGDRSIQGVASGNTVLINTKGKDKLSTIMGHEVSHIIRKKDPQLYSQIEGMIEQGGAFNEYKERLDRARGAVNLPASSQELAIEEVVSDMFGEMFGSKAFWEDVVAHDGGQTATDMLEIAQEVMGPLAKNTEFLTVHSDATKAMRHASKLVGAQLNISEVERSLGLVGVTNDFDVTANTEMENTGVFKYIDQNGDVQTEPIKGYYDKQQRTYRAMKETMNTENAEEARTVMSAYLKSRWRSLGENQQDVNDQIDAMLNKASDAEVLAGIKGKGGDVQFSLDEAGKGSIDMDGFASEAGWGKLSPAEKNLIPEAFKGSKVRDGDGNLKVLNHGTGRRFDSFEDNFLGSTTGAPSAMKGHFFAEKPSTSLHYWRAGADQAGTDIVRAGQAQFHQRNIETINKWVAEGRGSHPFVAQLRRENREAFDKDPKLESLTMSKTFDELEAMSSTETLEPRVARVAVNLQNPLEHDFKGRERDVSYNELLAKARRDGHDGAIFKNTHDAGPSDNIYVVFDTENIVTLDSYDYDFGDAQYVWDAKLVKNLAGEDIRFSIDEAGSRDTMAFPAPESSESTDAVHLGDGGTASDTTLPRMSGGRSTGHFGTGVYFLSEDEAVKASERKGVASARGDRPSLNLDLSKLNMLKPRRGARDVHNGMREINKAILSGEDMSFSQPSEAGWRTAFSISLATGLRISESEVAGAIRKTSEMFKAGKNDGVRTPSTYVLQELGFEGIDVRYTELDNTDYGSVVFARPNLSNDINFMVDMANNKEPFTTKVHAITPNVTHALEMIYDKFEQTKSITTGKTKVGQEGLVERIKRASNWLVEQNPQTPEELSELVRGMSTNRKAKHIGDITQRDMEIILGTPDLVKMESRLTQHLLERAKDSKSLDFTLSKAQMEAGSIITPRMSTIQQDEIIRGLSQSEKDIPEFENSLRKIMSQTKPVSAQDPILYEKFISGLKLKAKKNAKFDTGSTGWNALSKVLPMFSKRHWMDEIAEQSGHPVLAEMTMRNTRGVHDAHYFVERRKADIMYSGAKTGGKFDTLVGRTQERLKSTAMINNLSSGTKSSLMAQLYLGTSPDAMFEVIRDKDGDILDTQMPTKDTPKEDLKLGSEVRDELMDSITRVASVEGSHILKITRAKPADRGDWQKMMDAVEGELQGATATNLRMVHVQEFGNTFDKIGAEYEAVRRKVATSILQPSKHLAEMDEISGGLNPIGIRRQDKLAKADRTKAQEREYVELMAYNGLTEAEASRYVELEGMAKQDTKDMKKEDRKLLSRWAELQKEMNEVLPALNDEGRKKLAPYEEMKKGYKEYRDGGGNALRKWLLDNNIEWGTRKSFWLSESQATKMGLNKYKGELNAVLSESEGKPFTGVNTFGRAKTRDGEADLKRGDFMSVLFRHMITTQLQSEGRWTAYKMSEELEAIAEEYPDIFSDTTKQQLTASINQTIGTPNQTDKSFVTTWIQKLNGFFWQAYPLAMHRLTFYSGRNMMYQGRAYGPIQNYFSIADIASAQAKLWRSKSGKGPKLELENSIVKDYISSGINQQQSHSSEGLMLNDVVDVENKFKSADTETRRTARMLSKGLQGWATHSLSWSDTNNRSNVARLATVATTDNVRKLLAGEMDVNKLWSQLRLDAMNLSQQTDVITLLDEGMQKRTGDIESDLVHFAPFIGQVARTVNENVNHLYATSDRTLLEQNVNNRPFLGILNYPRATAERRLLQGVRPVVHGAMDAYQKRKGDKTADISEEMARVRTGMAVFGKEALGAGIASVVFSYMFGDKPDYDDDEKKYKSTYGYMASLSWNPWSPGFSNLEYIIDSVDLMMDVAFSGEALTEEKIDRVLSKALWFMPAIPDLANVLEATGNRSGASNYRTIKAMATLKYPEGTEKEYRTLYQNVLHAVAGTQEFTDRRGHDERIFQHLGLDLIFDD